jgi:cadmium resistance protein CadD (predicted permease)
MTCNVGTVDRVLRIAVGLALLSLVFIGPQSWWGLLGLIPLVTGLGRFCPAYALLGVRTCANDGASTGTQA